MKDAQDEYNLNFAGTAGTTFGSGFWMREVDELAWLGAGYDQDTGNMQLQQQGRKATRKGITLGNYQEARIRRFHLTLDEYLQAQT